MLGIKELAQRLAKVCGNISMGEYDKAHDLFDLTAGDSNHPVVKQLAESFGMMLVKVEAREYRLEQIIGELKETTAKLEQSRKLIANENSRLRRDLRTKFSTENIIGSSPPMQQLLMQVDQVADAPITVLVSGETGTGKDLVAKALHFQSERASGPYVAINCSAIPESLLESELFGIEKGVASGVDARIGRFQQADGGTLFLDEIGDMPLESQAKILRVIESGEVERVGGRTTSKVSVRVIAATHKDLRKMVDDGDFREDLFYRLNVIKLSIPALKDRSGDIPLLARYFLDIAVGKMRKGLRCFSPEAMQCLVNYDWPGNVRQLENEIDRAVVLSLGETITPCDLSPEVSGRGPICFSPEAASACIQPPQSFPGGSMSLEEGEKILIERALEEAGNNKSEAARILGISREGLRKKLKRFDM